MSELGRSVDLAVDFDGAVERVTRALKEEGFGVLTRIDIDQAFREKLGVEFRRYAILGACNPKLAHKALSATPEVGLLLPCNVCIEEIASGTRVHIVDPKAMMATGGLDERPEIRELGDDAGARLGRVAKALAG
jgi:uncharacterized protein (DUF302 family)